MSLKRLNKSASVRVLILSELKEVHYISPKNLLLHFVGEDPLSVFLALSNEDRRDAWDFAIYSNFRIINSPDCDRSLFMGERSHGDKTLSPPHSQEKSGSSLKLSEGRGGRVNRSNESGSSERREGGSNIFESARSIESTRIKELNVFSEVVR